MVLYFFLSFWILLFYCSPMLAIACCFCPLVWESHLLLFYSGFLLGHTDTVASLICWDNFLLSGSSDGTIKILGRHWRRNVASDLYARYRKSMILHYKYTYAQVEVFDFMSNTILLSFSSLVMMLIFLIMVVKGSSWYFFYFCYRVLLNFVVWLMRKDRLEMELVCWQSGNRCCSILLRKCPFSTVVKIKRCKCYKQSIPIPYILCIGLGAADDFYCLRCQHSWDVLQWNDAAFAYHLVEKIGVLQLFFAKGISCIPNYCTSCASEFEYRVILWVQAFYTKLLRLDEFLSTMFIFFIRSEFVYCLYLWILL